MHTHFHFEVFLGYSFYFIRAKLKEVKGNCPTSNTVGRAELDILKKYNNVILLYVSREYSSDNWNTCAVRQHISETCHHSQEERIISIFLYYRIYLLPLGIIREAISRLSDPIHTERDARKTEGIRDISCEKLICYSFSFGTLFYAALKICVSCKRKCLIFFVIYNKKKIERQHLTFYKLASKVSKWWV